MAAIGARRARRRDRTAPYPSTTSPPTQRGRRRRNENTPPGGTQGNASEDYWPQVGSTPPSAAMRTPLQDRANDPGLPIAPVPTSTDHGGQNGVTVSEYETELSGKQPHPLAHSDHHADLRKRAWMGSPSAELATKGSSKRVRAALPNERNVYTGGGAGLTDENPWALEDEEEGTTSDHAVLHMSPLATSTPVLRPVTSSRAPRIPSDNEFFLDNNNTSGCPPTPHYMHNSTFLERLRRSAQEDRPQANSINLSDVRQHSANLLHASGRSRTPTRSGDGSSPLPPSSLPATSPLPYSSPLPSSSGRWEGHVSEAGVAELLAHNKMRLRSILSSTEPIELLPPPATQPARAQHGRHRAQREDRGLQGSPSASDMEEPWNGKPNLRAAAAFATERAGGRARTIFTPIPMTRAALHVQAQIEERLAATAHAPHHNETRNRIDGPAVEEARRQPAARTTDSTRSNMNVDPPTPSRRSEGGLRPSPLTEWLLNRLPSPLAREREPQSGAGREAEQSSPGRPDDEPDWNDQTANAPAAVPTILTAVAPNIDRPMLLSDRTAYRVHRDDPEAIIRGIKHAWVEAVWGDPSGTVVLVEVFNFHYTENIHAKRVVVETLRRMIYVITGEEDVYVVPPELDGDAARRQREAPCVFAIRGLSPDGESAILSRFPWSFRAITFFAYKREVTPDSWLLSLEGFLDENTHAIKSAVRDALEEPVQWERLVSLTRGNQEFRGLSGTERANKILDSIEIKTWRLTNGNVITNVFILPPTRDIPKWREWATPLRNRTYGNFVNGTGVVRRISSCLGCHSVEHPTHRCPFHDLPGWQGPRAGAGTYSTLLPPPPPPPAPVPTQQRRRDDRRAPNQREDRNRGQATPRRRGRGFGQRN